MTKLWTPVLLEFYDKSCLKLRVPNFSAEEFMFQSWFLAFSDRYRVRIQTAKVLIWDVDGMECDKVEIRECLQFGCLFRQPAQITFCCSITALPLLCKNKEQQILRKAALPNTHKSKNKTNDKIRDKAKLIYFPFIISQLMNRSSVRQHPSMHQINKQTTVITYDQFEHFLKTLPLQQAQQLAQIAKTHALIHHESPRRIFLGTDKIMQDLEFLIQQAANNDITSLDISASQTSQSETVEKQIFYFHAPRIYEGNYKGTKGELFSMKSLAHNLFQLIYEQKQVIFDNRTSENQIFISNRCSNNKNIFMIFQKVHQIMELQSLIDTEIKLEDIHTTIDCMQNEGGKMFETQILEDRKLYWFKRTSKADWLKFINNINKLFGSEDIILMKFRLFQQLLQHQSYFNCPVRLAIDDSELNINFQRVSKCKILENNKQSMHRIQKLAIELLEKGSKHLSYKGTQVDQISCFNYYLLQTRRAGQIHIVRPSTQGKKAYIYFVFYRKYMLIQANQQSKTVELKDVNIMEEIRDKYYILALEGMQKHAVINQLPFVLLYSQAANIDKVALSDLSHEKEGDYTHLLAYQYLLKTPKYKVDSNPIMHKIHLSNKYEKPFKLVFNKTSPIYNLMGQTRSEEVVSKRRFSESKIEKGCIQAPAHFCREFIRKCFEQSKKK